MKKRFVTIGLMMLLVVLIMPQTMFAAPQYQTSTDEVIQIVLVLDVSGSMGTPVYTGIVPEDLLSLLLRLDELKNDPEILDLQAQIEEAENDPDVKDAKNAIDAAYDEMNRWISENYDLNLEEIQTGIRTFLTEKGCGEEGAEGISTAGDRIQIEFQLVAVCPTGSVYYQFVSEAVNLVPYLMDPDYQVLRGAWQEANQAYDDALEEAGYTTLTEELEAYKAGGEFKEVQAEIDRLVDVYNIPSRLELAKSAAINLIDWSNLQNRVTGVEVMLGLVTFSNEAYHQHSLTFEHEEVEKLIRDMTPLYQTNIGAALNLGISELEANGDPEQTQVVLLLSDGHANVGLTSPEILTTIPPRANSLDITLCTAGFADLETEVDFVLLEGLADLTDGEYLFTNSGVDLGSFFVACMEAAAGKSLAGRLTGILNAGDFAEAGRVEVEKHTCDLSLALNFEGGEPTVELVDPEGDEVDPQSAGVNYQSTNQVQLLTITDPVPGEWIINISNEGDLDAAYSILITTSPCEGPPPEEDTTEFDYDLPYLISEEGMSAVTWGIIILVVLLAGATSYVVIIRQRRS
jgi:hypothetical protein